MTKNQYDLVPECVSELGGGNQEDCWETQHLQQKCTCTWPDTNCYANSGL